jgi:succinate-acetate transporter protein
MAMPSPAPREPVRLVPPADQPTAGPLAGDPGMLGLPSFIIGTVAIGLISIGVLPTAPTTAMVPILLAATSVGLFLATIWAAITGQNAAAGIYGIFGGFFSSYAVLQLGMAHNWFGISPAAYADTAKTFLICWMVIVTMLILATLRLPVLFTALFTLVDVTLLLSLLQVIHASSAMQKATGWTALAVAAVGIYLFISAGSHDTGGKELPVGKPILHS